MSTEQTGLERAKAPGVITSPDGYRVALAKWAEQYHVMTPFTNISGIAPSFGIIASVVKIETDPIKGEVYSGFAEDGRKAMPFLKGEKGKPSEELAIAKVGLRKLAECAGISTSTLRTDPRTIPNYWEFKAIATYRGLDGSVTTREATFEWDLRDGSDRMKGWTANQITEGRKNGLRACEARAINAAIRECGCGIKQKYTRGELEKPFLVVRIAFQPDMQDPDIKRMVTQQAMTGVSALYPSAHRELPTVSEVVDQHEGDEAPRSVGRGTTAAPAAAAAKPAGDVPPVEGAVKIADTDVKPWEKGGRKGSRYLIIDSNGVTYSTLDKKHYDDALRFKASGDWVEIVTERNGEYVNILEIVKAGSEPGLPGLDGL